MLKFKCTAALMLAAVFSVPNEANAVFLPSTATVDVDIKNILLLSDIETPAPLGIGVPLAAMWNAQSAPKVSLDADGIALLDNRFGPSEWSNPATGSFTFSTSTSALLNGSGIADADSYSNVSQSTVVSGASPFATSGPLMSSSMLGGGTHFATGLAEITNAFRSDVLSDVSAPPLGNSALATANSLVGIISLDLASAADIQAINGGSSVFDIEVFIDTVISSIILTTDGPGSFARGEFSLTGSITSFAGLGNTGGATGFTNSDLLGTTHSDNQNTGDGIDVTSITTALGPDTSLGLTSTPFLDFTVDASTSRSVRFTFALTSTAEVISPIPEPSSIVLMMAGFAGLGCLAYRRRCKAVTVEG